MIIRPALVSDTQAIAQLHIASWRSTYRGMLSDAYLDDALEHERLEFWRQRLLHPQAERMILVAYEQDQLLGFVCATHSVDTQWGALLDNLHVHPASKGLGIGKQLLRELCHWLEHHAQTKLHLWVLAENHAAQKFYLSLGAQQVEQSFWDCPDGNQVPEFRFAWTDIQALRLALAI
jgi:ribosomal protein S18 acetylase RimI-like enzyme